MEACVVPRWPWPFDAWLPQLGLLIELDGEGHDACSQQAIDYEKSLEAVLAGYMVVRLHHSNWRWAWEPVLHHAIRMRMQFAIPCAVNTVGLNTREGLHAWHTLYGWPSALWPLPRVPVTHCMYTAPNL